MTASGKKIFFNQNYDLTLKNPFNVKLWFQASSVTDFLKQSAFFFSKILLSNKLRYDEIYLQFLNTVLFSKCEIVNVKLFQEMPIWI